MTELSASTVLPATLAAGVVAALAVGLWLAANAALALTRALEVSDSRLPRETPL